MRKMDIPEYIKNRIINLTLYTRTSAKRILSIVSTDDIKLTIEDYCEILEEYSKKTGEEITKGNSKEIELKAIEDSLLVELYEEGLRDYQIINYLLDNGYVISPNDLKDRLRVLRENNKLEGRRVTINKKTEWRPDSLDKEVIKLFEQDYTYVEIANYLERKGMTITAQGVRTMISRIFRRMGKEMPKRTNWREKRLQRNKQKAEQNMEQYSEPGIDIREIDKSELNRILLNLKETKNATDEQLKKIAEVYEFNFENKEQESNPHDIIGEDRE